MVSLLLAAATLAALWQVLGNEFVNYDDGKYVTDNAAVQTGLNREAVIWAFTTARAGNWHPLTWMSHILDCRLYGLKPMGHHLTSLLLHIANTLLLFLVLGRMTGSVWRSGFVAALFAVHPLHVESVAWVAERKDVLSTFFWMLAMCAYVHYAENPGLKRYLPVVLLFALGLTAKPMLVTLPFVLLLLDYWPLGRFASNSTRGRKPGWRLVWEKSPLFALSAASSAITYIAQRKGETVGSLEWLPLGVRGANALTGYAGYIGKMVWPRGLAVLYPHPEDTLPAWQVVGAGLLLVCISVLVVWACRGGPSRAYLAVGWLWYLGTLVPVIGLVQVGIQGVADRYTYVPLIGAFIMVAWAVPDLLTGPTQTRPRKGRVALLGAAAAVLISALMLATSFQARYWRSSVTLFEQALKVTTRNYLAHNNLGLALYHQGETERAVREYREAIRIKPDYAKAHNNLGLALAAQGKLDEAVTHYSEALRIEPDFAEAHFDLGIALEGRGRADEAILEYRNAIRLKPDYLEAHNNLGMALKDQGRMDEAMREFREAIRIRPNAVESHYNLGLVLGHQGRINEAIREYREVIRIKPDLAEAHNNLAMSLYLKGGYAEAWKEVRLCREYGGSPHPDFLRALSEKMREPVE